MDLFLTILFSLLSFLFGADEALSPEATQALSIVAEVVRVVDGDTIVVRIDSVEETVRYIGIDTPEPYRDGNPACFSLEASLKNQELVQGKTVRLESDQEDTDRYGRLLRYVYVDDTFVNAELISEGYAKSLVIKPNTTHASRFIALERAAREQDNGLWGECQ